MVMNKKIINKSSTQSGIIGASHTKINNAAASSGTAQKINKTPHISLISLLKFNIALFSSSLNRLQKSGLI
jgi:hypothetical protein